MGVRDRVTGTTCCCVLVVVWRRALWTGQHCELRVSIYSFLGKQSQRDRETLSGFAIAILCVW